MTKQYNFKNIRDLLTEGFTDEELRRICYDVPNFRPVYDQLSQSSSKTEIVDRLIEYTDRRLQIEDLLALAKDSNPARYKEHQPYYNSIANPNLVQEQPDELHRWLSSIRINLNEVVERKQQEATDTRSFNFGSFQRDEEVGPSNLDTRGLAKHYETGLLVWHDLGKYAQQAFAVYGGIAYRFRKMDRDSWRKLGFPITDEHEAAPSPYGTTGRYNLFEEGVIVWHERGNFCDQTFAIWGLISSKYNSLGGTGSYLGFPISEPYTIPSGERCDFEGGAILFLNDSKKVHIVRQLLRIDYMDSPFNHGWEQYDGQKDPNCVSVSPGLNIGSSKNFLAFHRSWGKKAIRYPASDFNPHEVKEKYCGITVKSLGPAYWIRFYLQIKTNGTLIQHLEFDSEIQNKEPNQDISKGVEYWRVPIPPQCTDGSWHTLIFNLEDQVQEGFTKSFECLQRFKFRGDIGIAELLVSDSRESIEQIALNPIIL